MAERPRIIIGNWKMYKTHPEAESYLSTLIPLVKDAPGQVCLAVPFTLIYMAAQQAIGTSIAIGAQTMNDASEGAFTGEIAARMLTEAGATFVILGHSERRRFFGETDAIVQRKVQQALQNNLRPVVCVGETLAEREAGKTEEVLHRQLSESLAGFTAEQAQQLWIAYEPVWAIGTGETATTACAEEVHRNIRTWLTNHWNAETAEIIPLLYGGSVKPDNAAALLEPQDIDGLLVGGASLSPQLFANIVNAPVNSPVTHPSSIGNPS